MLLVRCNPDPDSFAEAFIKYTAIVAAPDAEGLQNPESVDFERLSQILPRVLLDLACAWDDVLSRVSQDA